MKGRRVITEKDIDEFKTAVAEIKSVRGMLATVARFGWLWKAARVHWAEILVRRHNKRK